MTKADQSKQFSETIKQGYTFSQEGIVLGGAVFDGKPVDKLLVQAELATLNRHGLIAGATGTGKTRTLQKITEALSSHGCPVFIMDIKGDLSGISQPGTSNPKIEQRQQHIGTEWKPQAFPVEFLTISNEPGVRLRATVSEFGPLLLSRILELNETQSSVVSLIFKFCDDNHLPLLDIKDFKKALQYLTNEGKDTIKQDYGVISTASASAIIRKLVELEEQGADLFFGEASFDVNDLMRTDAQGRGYVNILRLTDIQNRPKLFSTFMLCMLAEVYEKLPEVGDIEKPKLIIFIDEAHLIFDQASKALLDQIEMIVKLIRSKGVGIYFCTQSPTDIPASVLGQLGMKVQHSLRAFTAKDRKAIKLVAENYPNTDFYDVAELLTSLGIGEALVTVLNDKGAPTPLVDTLISTPESSMTTITNAQIEAVVARSALANKYKETLDRDSAYEMLSQKLGQAPSSTTTAQEKGGKKAKSMIEQIASSPMARQAGRTLVREITRGLFGILGGKK